MEKRSVADTHGISKGTPLISLMSNATSPYHVVTHGGERGRQHFISVPPMKTLQCIHLCTKKEIHIDLTL